MSCKVNPKSKARNHFSGTWHKKKKRAEKVTRLFLVLNIGDTIFALIGQRISDKACLSSSKHSSYYVIST